MERARDQADNRRLGINAYIAGDIKVFRASERSTLRRCLELRPRCGVLQQRRRASGTGGGLEAPERFAVRWHEDEANRRRRRNASVMGGVEGNGDGGETVVGKPRSKQERDSSQGIKQGTTPTTVLDRTRPCHRILLRVLRRWSCCVFLFFFVLYVLLSVASPPGGHDSDTTTAAEEA